MDLTWAILASAGGIYGLVRLLSHLGKQSGRDLFALLAAFVAYPWALAVVHLGPFDKGLVYTFCVFMIPLYALSILRLIGIDDARLTLFRWCSLGFATGLATLALTNPWFGLFARFDQPVFGQPNHMLGYQVAGIGMHLTRAFAGIVITSIATSALLRMARSRFVANYFLMAVLLPMGALVASFDGTVWNVVTQHQINPFILCTTIALFCFSILCALESNGPVMPITHAKLLGLLPDAVVNVGGDGRVVDCNLAFSNLAGRSVDATIGQQLATMLPHTGFLTDDIIGQHSLTLTVNEGIRHYDLSISPVDNSNTPTGDKLIVFRDVTDQTLAYHQLQTSERHLHAANSELARLSTTDSLTGLRNRRYFQEHLELEMERFARGEVPYGLLSLDIDHFKAINDTYGHQAGDAVLIQVSRVLETQCRAGDNLARVGGEEFMVLLAGGDCEGVVAAAERFRISVQDQNICLDDGSKLNVTISVGATLSRPTDTMRTLMTRVDERLYAAKHRGRNLSVASS